DIAQVFINEYEQYRGRTIVAHRELESYKKQKKLKSLKKRNTKSPNKINPNVAKVGGFQSQGVKGEAVIGYRKPLTTQELKFSVFPEG
ncbi:hypothetical protein ACFLZM_07245, partial [Thermodesulfobacteriota bacterium]